MKEQEKEVSQEDCVTDAIPVESADAVDLEATRGEQWAAKDNETTQEAQTIEPEDNAEAKLDALEESSVEDVDKETDSNKAVDEVANTEEDNAEEISTESEESNETEDAADITEELVPGEDEVAEEQDEEVAKEETLNQTELPENAEEAYAAEDAELDGETDATGEVIAFRGADTDIESEDSNKSGLDAEAEETDDTEEADDAEKAENIEEANDIVETDDIEESDNSGKKGKKKFRSRGKGKDGKASSKNAKNGKGKKSGNKHAGGKAAIVAIGNKLKDFFNGQSIKKKLIGGFLIPVVLIVLLGVVSYYTASNAIIKSYKESSKTTIGKTADYYNLMFSNVKATATDLVNDSAIQSYFSGAYSSDPIEEGNKFSALKSSVSSTVISNKSLSNIMLIGSYGKAVYASSSALTDTGEYDNIKNSDEGKQIDKKKAVWLSSRQYVDTKSKNSYAVSYGRQLLGTSKKNIGYMFFDVDISYVKAPMEDIDLGSKSVIALITPDGGEVVTSNYKTIDEGTKYITDKDIYTQAMESSDNTGTIETKYDGKSQLFLYSKTDDGFLVCALIPQSAIVAQASTIKIVSITMIIIAMVIAVLIGGYFATSISKTIQHIMSKLELAAGGDLTVAIDVKSRDEFGILAGSTNGMIANVKQLIEKTKHVSGKVDTSVETVSDSAKNLLRETKEITMAIQEIEKGVVQQAEDSEGCLRQMDELSDRINDVSENSERIAKIADETNEIVHSGIQSIDELKGNANSTVEITHQVIEEILNLKESSKSISNIISAINEIAEQTNLLSLNASIEAARAGDAGRGFAVVAAEIRKLAEQSVNSANEIGKIVEDINEKTNDTVKIAKKAEDVVEVQGVSLENATTVFNQIQERFAGLVSNLSNITGGIEQIADAKAQTIDAIQSISAVSQETAAASEEVTETANRQLEAVEKLNRASEDLTSNSGDLAEAIDLFTI